MFFAPAEIELSTISANAVLKVYPMDLIEFMRTLGEGVFSILTDISVLLFHLSPHNSWANKHRRFYLPNFSFPQRLLWER